MNESPLSPGLSRSPSASLHTCAPFPSSWFCSLFLFHPNPQTPPQLAQRRLSFFPEQAGVYLRGHPTLASTPSASPPCSVSGRGMSSQHSLAQTPPPRAGRDEDLALCLPRSLLKDGKALTPPPLKLPSSSYSERESSLSWEISPLRPRKGQRIVETGAGEAAEAHALHVGTQDSSLGTPCSPQGKAAFFTFQLSSLLY